MTIGLKPAFSYYCSLWPLNVYELTQVAEHGGSLQYVWNIAARLKTSIKPHTSRFVVGILVEIAMIWVSKFRDHWDQRSLRSGSWDQDHQGSWRKYLNFRYFYLKFKSVGAERVALWAARGSERFPRHMGTSPRRFAYAHLWQGALKRLNSSKMAVPWKHRFFIVRTVSIAQFRTKVSDSKAQTMRRRSPKMSKHLRIVCKQALAPRLHKVRLKPRR